MQPLSPFRQLTRPRDQNDRFCALQELALQLSTMIDQQSIAVCAADWLGGLGFGALIVRVRPEHQDVSLAAVAGFPAPSLDSLRSYAPIGSVPLHGPGELVEDALQDKRFHDLYPWLHDGSYQALVLLPLHSGEHRQGTLLVCAPSATDLDPTTLNLFELLARQISLAMTYAQIATDLESREIQTEQRHQHLRRAYELVSSERRTLTAVLDSASDAVLVTDPLGIVQLGNPAVEPALGVHPDLLIGHPLEQTAVPEQLVRLMQLAQARAGNQEGEIVLTEGRVFHVSIAPVQTFDEPIQGYVALLKDITYFKRLDEMKSRFVATVSHDLKSPLHVIGGYVRLLERAGPLNSDQSEFVAQIMTSVRHLTALVTDLLDLGRLEAKVGIEIAPCDVVAILYTTMERYRVIADEKHIALESQPSLDLPLVQGDERRLQQVVSNLLSNAITYTPTFGIVQLRGEVLDDYVRISVQDSGIGIPPRDMAHIFEPFYRAENAKQMHSGGTGLGLAIVKRVIDEHAGSVGVESTPNNGSTFWFTIPLTK